MTLFLIGLLFLVAGGLRTGQLLLQWRAMRGWQQTTGSVTRSELVRVSPRDEPDSIAMYEPNIIYTYTVDGRHYRGEVTDDDIGLVNHRRGQSLMGTYAGDAEISVYYDPVSPWISTLFPGSPDLQRQIFYAGAGIIAGTVFIILGTV